LKISVGEKDIRIRVPAAFPVPGWGKLFGKNRYGLRTFGSLNVQEQGEVDEPIFFELCSIRNK
jgi:hypothetical protein